MNVTYETGYGHFCKICNRLMIPNNDGICFACQDTMKINGYVKITRCKDCKHRREVTVLGKIVCIDNTLHDPDWYCGINSPKESGESDRAKRIEAELENYNWDNEMRNG